MADTPSNMLPLGTKAPDFELLDTVSQKRLNLQQLKGENATVIMFICNHCPFVIHVNPVLVAIANHYQKKGISFIAISSNDAEKYPQDAPDKMTLHAKENKYPFVYLYDETQEVAKAYDAACTPDLYVFNKELDLVYRGQIDDSRPRNGITATGDDLKHALDCVLNNKENTKEQKPSIGCNIKWKN
ncbi:thioredoxin family protein [Oceanihabitans sediminis]|uniref:Thioredoxin family protein n=1 Tax=Oceanihabitans sediminis TaxID=1812012 RepID=A0A368P492_9FLAO|nr:thioredoxin family protein [Oceanihabitans sediminis]MDX1278989.1 thioredoxin family protein [Oceanihabitans sediminis]MDX1774257.1 thioredoxin family protein [Oceanihabitans sediminis]RBP29941.1 peroxiredoxin [Oceanihabitans sediminis]RCU57273.1 thioredoxin family protein [Oceanihabitans sediminis]